MNEFVYIACCMTVAFVVGLVIGSRIGYLNAMQHAHEQLQEIAKRLEARRATTQAQQK